MLSRFEYTIDPGMSYAANNAGTFHPQNCSLHVGIWTPPI